MTNAEISALRKIAADHRIPATRRLHAIDRLASIANVYIVEAASKGHNDRHWDTTRYLSAFRPTGIRAKRAVISLLRQLPECPRQNDRLLFLRGQELYERGRVNQSERIFRLKPPKFIPPSQSEQVTPVDWMKVVDDALRKVEAEHRSENVDLRRE
jgi:hypothetical protein